MVDVITDVNHVLHLRNEFNCSDVHGAMNGSGSLAKLNEPLWGSFTLHATHCGS